MLPSEKDIKPFLDLVLSYGKASNASSEKYSKLLESMDSNAASLHADLVPLRKSCDAAFRLMEKKRDEMKEKFPGVDFVYAAAFVGLGDAEGGLKEYKNALKSSFKNAVYD